jgi:hypothetical protein
MTLLFIGQPLDSGLTAFSGKSAQITAGPGRWEVASTEVVAKFRLVGVAS